MLFKEPCSERAVNARLRIGGGGEVSAHRLGGFEKRALVLPLPSAYTRTCAYFCTYVRVGMRAHCVF